MPHTVRRTGHMTQLDSAESQTAWRESDGFSHHEFVDGAFAFSVFLNAVMDKTERIVHVGWRAVKINEGFYRKHKTEEVMTHDTHACALTAAALTACLFP